MLLLNGRATARDIEAWERFRRHYVAHGALALHQRRVQRAESELLKFTERVPRCYCGVSWGKDSVVVADMVSRLAPQIPLVWIRVSPIENPDCFAVRDTFLEMHPRQSYREIVIGSKFRDGEYHATGTLEQGFEIAANEFGDAHVSGIRGAESGMRALRVARYGESSARTCAPIARWDGADVFAFLIARRLPIAEAYACTIGGNLDPCRIRVASLGGKRGDGWGRAAWEWRYYEQEMLQLFPRDSRPA